MRAQAVDLLGLQPGETVFDVACGAGAFLPALSRRVGPTSRVIGIEQSPTMAAQPRSTAQALTNTEVLCDAEETFEAGRSVDALILCNTQRAAKPRRARQPVAPNLSGRTHRAGRAVPGTLVGRARQCLGAVGEQGVT